MAHTNVEIPSYYSTQQQMANKIKLLEAELAIQLDYINHIEREFSNIPEAIEKYGYVDLKNHNGRFLMKIVKAKDE